MLRLELVEIANMPKQKKIDYSDMKMTIGQHLALKYDAKKLEEQCENERVFRDRECIAHEYCTRVESRRKRKTDIVSFLIGICIGTIFFLYILQMMQR